MILGREPAVLLGAIQAVLALAIGFGLQFTGEQVALIMAATAAVFTVIARQTSTPLASPVLEVGKAVTTPAGENAVVVPQ